LYQLGLQFAVHRDRVSRILHSAGVERRYHQTVAVNLTRAAELNGEGLTLQQIADRIGVGRTSLVAARRSARG
jgi:hypothetical protein